MPSNMFLWDTAVKATIILSTACLLALALRRASAATRYFLWTSALAAVLLIPVVSVLLPRWPVPVQTAAPQLEKVVDSTPDVTTAAPPEAHSQQVPWPVLIWLAGAVIGLIHIAVGHARLARLLHRARVVRDPHWTDITLRSSSETDVPLTAGVFRPSVVLPESSQEWDAERRHLVMLHELTHARRRDPLIWLMARVAAACYWFHPLAWLALARCRRDQECSCDDAVVRAGTPQIAYAEHLVSLARSVTSGTAAALGIASPSDLDERVRALLDRQRNRQALDRRFGWVATVVLLAVVLPFAALHAQDSSRPVSLGGTVYDATGAVIPGALALLKNNTSHEEAARTNAAGAFTFAGLPGGQYTLELRAPGFAVFQSALTLPAGHTKFTLELGQVSEAVEVVGKAPAAPATGMPQRIRVGGMVQATKLVSMVKPAYPPSAESAGIEGTVLLRAVISTSGDLLSLSVISQAVDGDLAAAAMDAVKQWHYQPTLLNGEPVEVVTTIAVTFRLEK